MPAAALALAAVAASSSSAGGQAARRDSSAAGEKVAVVIYAEASAREVRFEKQPTVRVRLDGALDSVHVVERRNLPSPVVAGTTYRNVFVAVEIFGRLNAECIANSLTGGAKLDCAALELRGTARPPSDTSRTPRS